MLFKSLEVENGLSYQNLKVDFDQQGLVLVEGDVGVGKSSIFDLLTHVLYGVTPKPEISGPAIMNRYVLNKAGKPHGYRGVVEFENAQHSYRVEQLRGHEAGNGLTLLEDGQNINVKVNRSESLDTQKLVAVKTGMSVREYYGGVYMCQGYTHDLVTGKPKARQEYLLRYFGIDLFDRMIPEVKDRADALAKDADMGAHKARLDALDAEATELGDSDVLRSSIATQQATQQTQEATIKDADAHHMALRLGHEAWTRYDTANRAVAAHVVFPSSAEDARTEFDSLRLQDEKLRLEQEASKKAADLLSRLEDEDRLPDVQATQQEAQALQATLVAARKDAPVRSKVAQLQGKIQDTCWDTALDEMLVNDRAKLKDETSAAAILQSDLSKLSKLQDVCFTCLRPVDAAEKAAWITDRQTQLADVTKKLDKITKRVRSLETTRESHLSNERLKEQIQTLEASLSGDAVDLNIDTAQDTLKDLMSRVASHMRYVELETKLATLGASSLNDQEVTEMRTRWKLRIQDLRAYLALLDAVPVVVPDAVDLEDLQIAAQALKEARTAYQTTRDQLARDQQLLVMVERVQRQRAKIVADMQSLAETIRQHRIMQTLHVSLKALRGLKLHEATKRLVGVLPMYLSSLFQGEHITVDVEDIDDSSDLVFLKNGTRIPLEGLSGGQQRKLGLSILFAFTQIANRNSNIMILDEPYTNLDPRSRSACYEILRDLLGPDRRNKNLSSIFVMSHDQDLKLQRFDQRWSVKSDGRISTLVK